jgi:hypothetical protein
MARGLFSRLIAMKLKVNNYRMNMMTVMMMCTSHDNDNNCI